MTTASPTARCYEYCRKRGWDYGPTSWWNHHAKIRQDLFGIIDFLVVDDLPGTLYVQTTTGSNAAARRKKIAGKPVADRILLRGNRVECWLWRKLADKHWHLRRDYYLGEGRWMSHEEDLGAGA